MSHFLQPRFYDGGGEFDRDLEVPDVLPDNGVWQQDDVSPTPQHHLTYLPDHQVGVPKDVLQEES